MARSLRHYDDPTTARYRQLEEQETGPMSVKSTAQAHINYELIGEPRPEVVLIEFMNAEIVDPSHARELGEQLASLVRDDLPRQIVLDFKDVRALGSTAFG